MYNLHYSVAYEGEYIACSGNLDEIKDWIRQNKDVSVEDLYITMDADVCIYDVAKEARE